MRTSFFTIQNILNPAYISTLHKLAIQLLTNIKNPALICAIIVLCSPQTCQSLQYMFHVTLGTSQMGHPICFM